MRLYLLNPDKIYDLKVAVASSRGKKRDVERDLAAFEKIGLIKRRRYLAEGRKGKKVSLSGWSLNPSFVYLAELRAILLNDIFIKGRSIVERLGKGGTLRLVVLAGIFIQNWESRVDILIAGDKLKRGVLERVIHSVESEIGRELRYAILDSSDVQYRISIGDRLVRDVLDFPHKIMINKGLIN